MLRSFLLFFCICFTLFTSAQEGKMSYVETNKNIGDVTFFENHIITFNYINNTKETLVFKPFRAEIDLDIHFQRKTVAPGESGFFVVKYFSENIGAFTKKFIVYTTNDIGVELTINGVIKSFSKENTGKNPSYVQRNTDINLESEKTVQFYVLDADTRKPIPYAKIQIMGVKNSKAYIGYSDEKGLMANIIPPGEYIYEFFIKNYEKESSREIDDENNTVYFLLKKKPIEEEKKIMKDTFFSFTKPILDSPKRIEKSREILAQKAKETPAKAIEKVIPTPAPKIVAFQDFEKEETSVKKEERISPSKPTPTKVFTDRTGARIVFLIDISSSMNKPFKMDLLKETLKNLIDVLKPQDQIALITFNYETKVIWPLSNLEDKDAVKLTIDDIQTTGGTKGAVGIEKAYEAIKENLGENSLIVLATDGLLTNNKEEEENIYKIIDTHYTQNILFNVLGFGISQHIHFKMNKLAMLGGGFFMPFVASKKNQEKQFIDNILNKLNRK